MIAVLLAQAAGIWHEQQQQDQLASQARAAITSEMRANEAELDKLRASMNKNIASLSTMGQDKAATKANLQIDMSLALLSEAAWRTALETGAVRYVDYAWNMKVAKVYELQELVLHAQSSALDQVADISDSENESPHAMASHFLSHQRSLAELADGLDASYREALGSNR
ncbi:MAG TPA: hypothetical protein VK753_08910 [Xanthomonadaceae bacterium]|nr:hypothetical protein [Xanthomonadaceae bacterium]